MYILQLYRFCRLPRRATETSAILKATRNYFSPERCHLLLFSRDPRTNDRIKRIALYSLFESYVFPSLYLSTGSRIVGELFLRTLFQREQSLNRSCSRKRQIANNVPYDDFPSIFKAFALHVVRI